MPGCPEEVITKIEERLNNIKPVSQMISEGYTPEMIINDVSGGDYHILETNPIKYECDCSKERFARGIATLGYDELTKIINEDEKAEVLCHFCMKKYNFNKSELISIRDNFCKK